MMNVKCFVAGVLCALAPLEGCDEVRTLEDVEYRPLLIKNGLALDGLATLDVDTESGRELIAYAVECALPEGEALTLTDAAGVPHTFPGLAGLAPELADDACDEDCQRWVSACVLARTNAEGTSVAIELVADHDAIGFDPTFPHREGAFFGNLVGAFPRMYACWGEDVDVAVSAGRVCASSTGNCVIDVLGPCSEVCAFDVEGAFLGCSDGEEVYDHVITTYVP